LGVQQGDRIITNYFEDKNVQLFGGGQWINPAVQAVPLATTLMQPAGIAPSPNTNEFMKDGNWDELGRIMEYYMMDPSDTPQECRYY